MAEKAIRLGGEATADAIVSAVDTMYSEHTFNEKDFVLKHNDAEIAMKSQALSPLPSPGPYWDWKNAWISWVYPYSV